MAILQFDEYKSKLLALKPTLKELAEALGLRQPVSYTHLKVIRALF